MIPRVLCRACGSEIELLDKFCSKCGTKVEWGESLAAPALPTQEKPGSSGDAGRSCPLCGNENPAGAFNCKSCGAKLTSFSHSTRNQGRKSHNESSPDSKTLPLKTLQSWKFTVGLGILLVAVVVILKTEHANEPPSMPALSPNAAEMVKKIESLQKIVDADPKNAETTLQLANLLHDVKALPRSITMYERYLELNPSNPDARVDLGISYFEMSVGDSTRRDEFLEAAKEEMEKALTYSPKHQLAHFNLGIVYLHNGDMEKANEWFKKCIAIDPNSETGRKAQQLISQHSFNNPS